LYAKPELDNRRSRTLLEPDGYSGHGKQRMPTIGRTKLVSNMAGSLKIPRIINFRISVVDVFLPNLQNSCDIDCKDVDINTLCVYLLSPLLTSLNENNGFAYDKLLSCMTRQIISS
jgi:hypothetical protein